jgi:hypothetical protein
LPYPFSNNTYPVSQTYFAGNSYVGSSGGYRTETAGNIVSVSGLTYPSSIRSFSFLNPYISLPPYFFF